jgi:hypothetical protein
MMLRQSRSGWLAWESKSVSGLGLGVHSYCIVGIIAKHEDQHPPMVSSPSIEPATRHQQHALALLVLLLACCY